MAGEVCEGREGLYKLAEMGERGGIDGEVKERSVVPETIISVGRSSNY